MRPWIAMIEEHTAGDPDHKENAYANRAASTQVVNLSLAAGLGLVMAGGILQAHLAFVPEAQEVKTRPIPQAKAGPTVTPWLTLAPETGAAGQGRASGALGLRGTF